MLPVVKRKVPCPMPETSTPPWLSFDRAVIAGKPYLTLSNLLSFWRTRYAPSGRIHSFPPASVSSCNMGTFDGAVMEVNETGLKPKPSKDIRPQPLPIQH